MRSLRIFHLFLFLFLFLFFSIDSIAQMRKIHSEDADPDNEIVSMSFYSASEGFVAFKKWVGYTADSGRTFDKKFIRTDNVDYGAYPVNLTFGFGISSIKAFDKNTIVISGDYGFVPSILTSTDGGNTFKLSFHSQLNPMLITDGVRDMIFPSGNTGFALDPDRVLKTTDGGKTWGPVFTRQGSGFTNISAPDNQHIFAFSSEYGLAHMFKSEDGGSTWNPVGLPDVAQKKIVYAGFRTANQGWLSLTDDNNHFYFYVTVNGGSTWSLLNDPDASPFASLKFRFISDSVGFALGGLFAIYKTTDGGKVWEPLPRNNDFSYLLYGHNDLFLLNETVFWAGGGAGLLEITNNGGGTPLPKAYFKADTSQVYTTGTVYLKNYSRSGYTYQWFVNGNPAGTTYNSSYTHNEVLNQDTIKLVVSNGSKSDTLVRYYQFKTPLEIYSFEPTAAGAGTMVTIKGKDFYDVTSVSFGGVPATEFYVVSPSEIQARVGTGASGSVRVNTSERTGSLPGFTFIPAPVITDVTPLKAIAGETVTISGTNFSGVLSVTFGGVEATSFIVESSTRIKAVVPSGPSGSVSVSTPGGQKSFPGFLALPVLGSFTPLQGTQGTVMTITGTSLTDIDSVTIGGIPVQSFLVHSDGKITAIVGTGKSGNVVVSKTGAFASKPGFSWFAAPHITSFSPVSGPVGTTVTITGKNFDPVASGNIVFFGDVKANVSAASATSLTVKVPAGASYKPISVLSNQLISLSDKPFLVTFTGGGSITSSSFSDTIRMPIGDHYNNTDLLSHDLDGDGKSDLILARYNRDGVPFSGVSVYRNTSGSGSISFNTPTILLGNWNQLRVADMDNDGKHDILVSGDDDASFFRNTSTPGNLSFAPVVILNTVKGAIDVFDADGDGKLDLIFSSGFYSGTQVMLNISEPGSVAFNTAAQILTEGTHMLTADIDRDGKSDLITNGKIYKNKSAQGRLNFELADSWDANDLTLAAIGDVDNDGKSDIITISTQTSLAGVLKNVSSPGNPAFEDPVTFQCSELPRTITLSDMDGDGFTDIVASLSNSSAGILRNISGGGKISFASKVDYVTGDFNGVRSHALADLDNDGRYEIVSVSELIGQLYIHQNKVKPEPSIISFTPTIATTGTTVTITGTNFSGVTAVRFGGVSASSFTVNSATTITATVAGGASGVVEVVNNSGTGKLPGFNFGLPPVISAFTPVVSPVGSEVTITGKNFNAVAAENIVYFGLVRAQVKSATATSLKVIVPSAPANALISVTVNKRTAYSSGYFSVVFPGARENITASSFDHRIDRERGGNGLLVDLDGDSKPELLMKGSSTNISIARNLSDSGKILFSENTNVNTGAVVVHRGLSSADMDGDGKQDVIASLNSGSVLKIFRNKSAAGNIQLEDVWTNTSNAGYAGSTPVIIDVDLDGRPDVVTISYNDRLVSVYRNESDSGKIKMGERIGFYTQHYANDLKVSDLNQDGKPELIVSTNGLLIFRNTSIPGKISFEQQNLMAGVSGPLDIGDLDRDGKPDVALSNNTSKYISLYRNISTSGNIEFVDKGTIETGQSTFGISIGDLDGDGIPDIVTQAISDYVSTIHKNSSSPDKFIFQPGSVLPQPDGVNQSVIQDIDGDGLPDIAAFGPGYFSSIYRNRTGLSKPVSYCFNGDVEIEAETSGASYQWQVDKGSGFINLTDDINYASVTAKTLSIKNIPTVWNGYLYRCLVDGTAGNTFMLTSIGTLVTPTVSLVTADSVICAGSQALFTSSATHGGAQPRFEWMVNGQLTGIQTDSFKTNTLTDGSKVSIRMISNIVCASVDTVYSNVKEITVNQLVTPSVLVSASSTEICQGTRVDFTANYTDGGTTPVFQWKKNGQVLNGTGNTYSDQNLAQGDVIRVTMVSNAACLLKQEAESAPIAITVNPVLVPEIDITSSAAVVVLGQSVRLTADISNGGTNPVFEWQDSTSVHGWQTIQGVSSASVDYMPAYANDKVRCILSSSALCASPLTVQSNVLTFDVQDAGRRVQVIPNPVTGTLNLVVSLQDQWEKLDILDMQGRSEITGINITNQAKITVAVSNLKPGLHIAVLRNRSGEIGQVKFMKQ